MPYRLDKTFKSITANPYQRPNYAEFSPCEALSPYVRCFWISENHNKTEYNSLVIPDICMDIIVTDHFADFCGINNRAFFSENNDMRFFGVRFFAWSVALFTDTGMNNALNFNGNAAEYFPDFPTTEVLQSNLEGKIKIVEKYLLNRLNTKRENADVMNSLYHVIRTDGRTDVADLSDYCAVSKRQLERKFAEQIGVSPKQMINLLRYQLLWQDCIKPDFNTLDSVEKFGYFDQSHMLNEFKKYHGISLGKARENVAFLQYTTPLNRYNKKEERGDRLINALSPK